MAMEFDIKDRLYQAVLEAKPELQWVIEYKKFYNIHGDLSFFWGSGQTAIDVFKRKYGDD